MPDALLGPARGVEDLTVGLEGAGVHAEEGELAHVRIGDGLEDDGGQRRLGIGRPRGRLLGARVGALDGGDIGG